MKALSRNIAIFISGFIITMLIVLFAIKPVLSDVGSLHDGVKQQKTESATLDQQIRAFKTAQSDLSKATRKDEVADAIPTRETLVDAVKDMESAVAKSGVEHTLQIKESVDADNKPRPVVANRNGIDEVTYRLSTVSDWGGLIKLTQYLEYLPHFTELSKISLSAETTEGQSNKVNHTGRVLGNFDGVFFIKNKQ